MKLEMIQTLRILIIAFLSYVPTCAFAGWFEAWVAKKMGDSIPKEYGFLTLNPFTHFSFFGFGLLVGGLLFGSQVWILQGIPGFGKTIPLMPSVLMGRYIKLRTFVECTARSYAHLAMALVAAAGMILFLNVSFFSHPFAQAGSIPLLALPDQMTTLSWALLFLVNFFFTQNVILFGVYFILGCFHTLLFLYFNEIRFSSVGMYIAFLIMLTLWISVGRYFLDYVVYYLLYALEYIIR